MRINVLIDDKLMENALKSGNYPTKRMAIEQGLKLLIRVNSQNKIQDRKGKIHLDGDFGETRTA